MNYACFWWRVGVILPPCCRNLFSVFVFTSGAMYLGVPGLTRPGRLPWPPASLRTKRVANPKSLADRNSEIHVENDTDRKYSRAKYVYFGKTQVICMRIDKNRRICFTFFISAGLYWTALAPCSIGCLSFRICLLFTEYIRGCQFLDAWAVHYSMLFLSLPKYSTYSFIKTSVCFQA